MFFLVHMQRICALKVRFSYLLLLASATLFATTLAPTVAKAKYTESMRYESRTIREFDGSSTETAARGKWSLTAEIPLENPTVGPDTAFEVKLGSLESTVRLKDDPKFKEGDSSAQFDLKPAKAPTGEPVAVAKLKWGKGKLTINLSAKSDKSPSAVAGGYVDNAIGELKGTIKLTVRFGDKTTDLEIPFTGKLGRKSVETEMISGQAVTIEMKGEIK